MRNNDCREWTKPKNTTPVIKNCRSCGNTDCEFNERKVNMNATEKLEAIKRIITNDDLCAEAMVTEIGEIIDK